MARKLTKGFLGTNNFDTNSRLCMASAAVGYARSLGADGPPGAYADLELADCFLLIGTNTADCHPDRLQAHQARKLDAPDDVTRHRRRPALDRDRRHRRSAPAAAAGLGHRAAQRDAARALAGRSCSTSASSPSTRAAGTRCARSSSAIRPSARAGADRAVAREHRDGGAGASAARARRSRCGAWGSTRAHVGTDKNAAILNLHLATGQIGRPGSGTVLAHRPAQRDGRPRDRRPRAICCPAIAP